MSTRWENESAPAFTWQEPLSKETIYWLVSLLGLLVVQWCAFKGHKLLLMTNGQWGPWFKTIVPVLFWDVLVLVPLIYLFGCWLEGTRGPARVLGLVALHGVVLVGMVAAAIEHRFFTITHSLVNWEMLRYGISQISMLSDMIRSQINAMTIGLLMLPFLVLSAPSWIRRTKFVARWLERDSGRRRLHSPLFLLVFLVVWVLLFSLHTRPLPKEVMPLRTNFAAHWLAGIIQSSHAGQRAVQHIKFDRKKMLFDAQRMQMAPASKPKRPNVVLIILESMRWRSTTMAKPSLKTTPFLASIAKKSIIVEDMVPVVPHTSKALVSIMCGIYPKVVMPITEAEVGGLPAQCLPSLLKPLGYQSAIFHPGTMRFEKHEQLFINMGYQGIYGREKMPSKNFFRTNYFGYEDRIMLQPSLQWIDRAQAKKKPFFLALHYLTSHHAYNTPPAFPKRPFGARKGTAYYDYLNALRYVDDFTRDLFAGFRKRGLMKNTVFVLVSDHGEAFGEHRRYQHDNSLWQEVLKIPVMIYSPKYFPKGGRIKGPRQQTDIVPTIAEILGMKLKDGRIPGSSLLKPPPPKRERYLSCWYERFCLAKIKGRYKYIYNYHRAAMELYDLKNDPKERHDLSGKPEFFSALKAAKQDMLRWKAKVNYVYETPDPYGLSHALRDHRPRVDVPVDARLGSLVKLVGLIKHEKAVRPGSPIEVTLVFQALQTIPDKWRLFFHLLTDRPHRFLNMDHVPVGGRYPFRRWQVGQYVLDRYRIHVPPDFPPGSPFRMIVGMWSRQGRLPVTGRRVSRRERRERALQVWRGRVAPPIKQPDGRPPLERLRSVDFGSFFHFGGFNRHSQRHNPGNMLDVTLVFKTNKKPPKGWKLFLHMFQVYPRRFVNVTGRLWPRPKPLSQWRPGRFKTFRLRVRIPRSFKRGRTLRLVLGIWHKKKPFPRISASKEERKLHKPGHLTVLEVPLR